VFICGLSTVGLADSFIDTSGVFSKVVMLAVVWRWRYLFNKCLEVFTTTELNKVFLGRQPRRLYWVYIWCSCVL